MRDQDRRSDECRHRKEAKVRGRESQLLAERAGARSEERLELRDVAVPCAARPEDTDWPQIAALYGALLRVTPGPIVELNAAAAVAMARGPDAGLAWMERLERSGALAGYHLLPAAQADLLRRLGRIEEARAAYRRALALVRHTAERRFLERRLAELP